MNKRHIVKPLWLLWGGMGGYRGHHYYNNDLEKKKFNKYSYITNIACVISYSLLYMIPPLCIVSIIDEFYNLENFITNINKGKNTGDR